MAKRIKVNPKGTFLNKEKEKKLHKYCLYCNHHKDEHDDIDGCQHTRWGLMFVYGCDCMEFR